VGGEDWWAGGALHTGQKRLKPKEKLLQVLRRLTLRVEGGLSGSEVTIRQKLGRKAALEKRVFSQ